MMIDKITNILRAVYQAGISPKEMLFVVTAEEHGNILSCLDQFKVAELEVESYFINKNITSTLRIGGCNIHFIVKK